MLILANYRAQSHTFGGPPYNAPAAARPEDDHALLPLCTVRGPLASRIAAPRAAVDPAGIGRRVVRCRAKGMDAGPVAAALEGARFDAWHEHLGRGLVRSRDTGQTEPLWPVCGSRCLPQKTGDVLTARPCCESRSWSWMITLCGAWGSDERPVGPAGAVVAAGHQAGPSTGVDAAAADRRRALADPDRCPTCRFRRITGIRKHLRRHPCPPRADDRPAHPAATPIGSAPFPPELSRALRHGWSPPSCGRGGDSSRAGLGERGAVPLPGSVRARPDLHRLLHVGVDRRAPDAEHA